MINVMREENRRKVAIYKDAYDAQCQKLVDEGKWERVFEHINPNYYMKLHGLVHVFRKKEELTKDEAFRRIMQVFLRVHVDTEEERKEIGGRWKEGGKQKMKESKTRTRERKKARKKKRKKERKKERKKTLTL